MGHKAVENLWSVAGQYHELRAMLGYSFMQAALVAAVLLSLVGGWLSVLVVLRRMVFVTAAIAEFSACGVAVALVRDAEVHALPWSLAAGLVGTIFLALVNGGKRVPKEALVGASYVGAAAASVLILAVVGKHEGHDLTALMWGDVLALSWHHVAWLTVALAAVTLLCTLFYKEFLLCAFDPAMARSLGVRVWAWDLLLFAMLGVSIALAMHLVGLLVVFAYLVVPGVIGLLVGRTMRGAFTVSMAAALAASLVGLQVSWVADLPTGLTVIAALVLLLPVAALVGRLRR